MSSGRAAKRARQKERQAERRSAIRSAVARRRRQRFLIVGLTSLVLVGVGSALAFVAFRDEAQPEASPAASPKAGPIAAPTPQPVACGADLPPSAGSKKASYSADEEQKLDPDRRYILRLETSCGTIDVELAVDDKPVTANSVVFLAREGFYDGLVFHRNVPGFAIQAGDPEGTGGGDPGYTAVEVAPIETKYTKGVVGMAKSPNDPPGASGSQFFIVTGENAGLPPDYAVLGKVVAGQDVAEKIETCCPGGQGTSLPQPEQWVYIERATVIEE